MMDGTGRRTAPGPVNSWHRIQVSSGWAGVTVPGDDGMRATKRANTMPAHIAATKMTAAVRQRRSRTKAHQSPTDAEDRGTDDDPRIDIVSRRDVKSFGEERASKPQDIFEANEGDGNCAGYHEGQAGVPGPARDATDI